MRQNAQDLLQPCVLRPASQGEVDRPHPDFAFSADEKVYRLEPKILSKPDHDTGCGLRAGCTDFDRGTREREPRARRGRQGGQCRFRDGTRRSAKGSRIEQPRHAVTRRMSRTNSPDDGGMSRHRLPRQRLEPGIRRARITVRPLVYGFSEHDV